MKPDLLLTGSKLLCAAVLAGVTAGCASTASQLPVPYTVRFTASKDVNPDSRGRPSPIRLQIFELKSATAFESSDFFALQGNASATLGAELIKNEQIMLRPGESADFSGGGNLQARQLGIVAEYRDLEANRWRVSIQLPEPRSTNFYKIWQFSPGKKELQVSVGNGGLDVSPEK
ncbi:MAG: type VI secretion system lipoprotein TssJ [Pigmentiphaga sp.]|uniref:type VI secretion system lipoprotein TssJ n=1 Tax=Pigmentiphaga sp. TaxID=1977564 RepID=UPI0029B63D28|nr:type VI secretion system lipoprotein TssJ [Pigmentiphaga sp.]MDX3905816.1 type VI secretion system lipoprotein TssJ [Pigmentiphaga sp.]